MRRFSSADAVSPWDVASLLPVFRMDVASFFRPVTAFGGGSVIRTEKNWRREGEEGCGG
ncbi:hypothetical protein [Planifilum fimeticola]